MDKSNKPVKPIKKLKEKLNNYIKSIGHVAGKHKQLIKISGMAVGIVTCSLILASFFTTGYEVYLGGEKVAVVKDKDIFEDRLELANAKITALVGKGYNINKLPKYVFTLVAKTRLTDNEKIVDNVMAQSSAISKVYIIKVDGNDIATAQTEQDAEILLEKAASVYDGENRQILNDIDIVSRYEAVSYLTGKDMAVKLLKNVLNVQTEKTSVCEAELMYGTIENPTEDMYVNEEKLIAEGKNGVMEVTAKVIEINGAVSGTTVISSKIISEPVSQVVMVGTTELPSVGTGIFQQPYFGTITSRFGARWGRTHKGTDIGGTLGDPIVAADNGIVATAEYQDNGYGNIVIIDHQNGIQTWYAHMDSIAVNAGDTVEKGAVIGALGNTGYSTGPHLHFEVRENGTPVDPGTYLEALN